MRTQVLLNTFRRVSGLKSLRKRAQSIPYKILHRNDDSIFFSTFIFSSNKIILKKKNMKILTFFFENFQISCFFQREMEFSFAKKIENKKFRKKLPIFFQNQFSPWWKNIFGPDFFLISRAHSQLSNAGNESLWECLRLNWNSNLSNFSWIKTTNPWFSIHRC